MARGWESKSVEAQIESRQPQLVTKKKKARTADQVHNIIEKSNLELARAKVMRELEASQNPRYSEMLKGSLADLERKIGKIE
ncbi:MAG: hypothetical protein ACR2IF_12540 [Terriglobales bacterium]